MGTMRPQFEPILKRIQLIRLNPLLLLYVLNNEVVTSYNFECFLSPVRLPVSPLRQIILSRLYLFITTKTRR